jgi:hypothetical protein
MSHLARKNIPVRRVTGILVAGSNRSNRTPASPARDDLGARGRDAPLSRRRSKRRGLAPESSPLPRRRALRIPLVSGGRYYIIRALAWAGLVWEVRERAKLGS